MSHRFFCVTTPGFEENLIKELKEAETQVLNPNLTLSKDTTKFSNLKTLKGGVEFDADIFHAVQLNFFLKTCTRILWRVDSFKAKDFLTLKEKLGRTKLKSMSKGYQLKYKIASSKSRIYNETKIQEICFDVLGRPDSQKSDWPVLYISIHVLENEFEISLDLSEAPLYQRGWAPLKEKAPLRETWVAQFFKYSSFYENWVATEDAIFIDPCAGSGTLGWEMLTFQEPQFERSFAFQNYPGAPKLFKLNFRHNYKETFIRPKQKVFLFDIDEKAVSTCEKNREVHFSKEQVFCKKMQALDIKEWQSCDFDFKRPLYIASNLPYGERLHDFDVTKLIKILIDLKAQGWNIKRAAFFVSAAMFQEAERQLKHAPVEILRSKPFINGGLSCSFFELEF